jgi:hypothetical protein
MRLHKKTKILSYLIKKISRNKYKVCNFHYNLFVRFFVVSITGKMILKYKKTIRGLYLKVVFFT